MEDLDRVITFFYVVCAVAAGLLIWQIWGG